MTVSRKTIASIRFGYGPHPNQVSPDGPGALLRHLEAAARTPMLYPIAPLSARRDKIAAAKREREQNGRSEGLMALRKDMRGDGLRDAVHTLFQRALSPFGFYERLAAFWSDHFTVSAKNVGQFYLMPSFEPEVVRPHLMGRFGDMLVAASQHPVMLIYLDQAASVGPNSNMGRRKGVGLNENLAREILELHTLGVGGPYTQTDVRELAELLTGYNFRRKDLTFRFVPNRAEPGAETVLGRSYGGGRASAEDAEAALQDLAIHPGTAEHMARKLCVHFIADQPDAAHVAHVAAAWRSSGGSLPAVYAALIDHPSAWLAPGRKIRQPAELVAATLRATGARKGDVALSGRKALAATLKTLRALGQPPHRAPGPDGWPEEAEHWINPQGLAARLKFAGQVGRRLARETALDPRIFAETALGETLRDDTAFAVRGAPDRWEGFALALASPEFNRR